MASTSLDKLITLGGRCFFAAAVLSLLACGATPIDDGKPVVYIPEASDEVSTLDYIPKQKANKKGELIPYKPNANPYLKRQGSVKSASVESFIQAKRALKASDSGLARSILMELTEKDKKLSGPWVLLGDIELEANSLELAEQHYSRAILINKHNVNAYLRLAKVKRMQGDFAKAKSTYADVLKLWKDFPEAHLNLGVLYDVYLNDKVRAQKHIEAYQFLTGGNNIEVAEWLLEIQERTGMAIELNMQKEEAAEKPVS